MVRVGEVEGLGRVAGCTVRQLAAGHRWRGQGRCEDEDNAGDLPWRARRSGGGGRTAARLAARLPLAVRWGRKGV